MRLKPVLALIRVPNAPTTCADVVGGFALAGGFTRPLAQFSQTLSEGSNAFTGFDALPLFLMCVASFSLYSGGMADNDVQHAEKDALLQKQRPITTEAISLQAARRVATVMFAFGIALAAVAGGLVAFGTPTINSTGEVVTDSSGLWVIGGIALYVVIAAMAYNSLAAGKIIEGTWQAPSRRSNVIAVPLMASCRAANVALGCSLGVLVAPWALSTEHTGGASAIASALSGELLFPLAIVFGYFCVVMGASLAEDFGGKRNGALALCALVLAVLSAIAVFTASGATPMFDGSMLVGWPLYVALTSLLLARCVLVIRSPSPRNFGMVVKWGIAGDCFLMGLFTAVGMAGYAGPLTLVLGLPIMLGWCFGVCWFLGRLSYST